MKSVPPLNELFDMAGLKLPEYLAQQKSQEVEDAVATKPQED